MVEAIRQIVTVQSEGTVEVRSPELRIGRRAEVIVLIEGTDCRPTTPPMEALNALQASLQLTAPVAADWIRQTRMERQTFGQCP